MIQSKAIVRELECKFGFTYPALKSLWKDKEILEMKPHYSFAESFFRNQECAFIPNKIFEGIPSENFGNSCIISLKKNESSQTWMNKLKNYIPEKHWIINTHPAILRAKKYLETNFAEIQSIKEVAIFVKMSPEYFRRLFKLDVGLSCEAYLTKLRMTFARELIIESTLSIKEISSRLGYKRPNHFSNTFLRYWGKSPGNYRKDYKFLPAFQNLKSPN